MQVPNAAKDAGFGMPILRRIGNSNRNTPELERALSRLVATRTCLLIATLFQSEESANRRSGEGSSSRANSVSEGPALRIALRHTILIANGHD